MYQSYLIGLTAALVAVVLLFTIDSGKDGCLIVISGESVVIKNCVYTSEFIDLVKGLKPHNHWSSL
ncbi:triple gene block protein 3 [Prunus mume chlorotic leaf curl-associated virus]|uniref:Movement protein TGBp3 n=1 Tax=Prunus mume chlorotic leaf curl-associated virus TaxID=3035954 RepID=A0A9Y1PS57_9VIRU|nr:triple gene block protein 3 [Prunus mume chlorotic leaf curl-associated virus]